MDRDVGDPAPGHGRSDVPELQAVQFRGGQLARGVGDGGAPAAVLAAEGERKTQSEREHRRDGGARIQRVGGWHRRIRYHPAAAAGCRVDGAGSAHAGPLLGVRFHAQQLGQQGSLVAACLGQQRLVGAFPGLGAGGRGVGPGEQGAELLGARARRLGGFDRLLGPGMRQVPARPQPIDLHHAQRVARFLGQRAGSVQQSLGLGAAGRERRLRPVRQRHPEQPGIAHHLRQRDRPAGVPYGRLALMLVPGHDREVDVGLRLAAAILDLLEPAERSVVEPFGRPRVSAEMPDGRHVGRHPRQERRLAQLRGDDLGALEVVFRLLQTSALHRDAAEDVVRAEQVDRVADRLERGPGPVGERIGQSVVTRPRGGRGHQHAGFRIRLEPGRRGGLIPVQHRTWLALVQPTLQEDQRIRRDWRGRDHC